jgi:NSS family neurotransmitter:Na+ symporter
MAYLFVPRLEDMTASGALEAVGQSFLSLNVGLGVMLTYGSYLGRDSDVPGMSVAIAGLDVVIALLCAVVVFTGAYASGIGVTTGLGLVFESLPVTFSHITGGWGLGFVFFLLLVLTALTSSVSLMEVVTSSLMDTFGYDRRTACLGAGCAGFLLGIPSALSSGTGLFGEVFYEWTGHTFLMAVDQAATTWTLPLVGALVALFVGHRLQDHLLQEGLWRGSALADLYPIWKMLIKVVVPVAVLTVLVCSSGLLEA